MASVASNKSAKRPGTGDRAATIVDVAKEAGVSLGTASRVLNGKASEIRISRETTERVFAAASKLRYRKNRFASGLRGQTSAVAGIIVRDLHDPFLMALVDAMQAVAHRRNIDVLIGHADYSSETADRQIRFMLDHWFSGLILAGNLPDDAELRERLTRSGIACVAVACNDDHLLDSVSIDDAEGAKLALDFLLANNHRRIAFLGDASHAGVERRADVYRRYSRENRITATDTWLFDASNRRVADMTEFRAALSSPDRPTALFCGSDYLALQVMNLCRDIGLAIPADLSLIGFDDIPGSGPAHPPLTTVRQPIDVMAAAAFDMLADDPDGNRNRSAIVAPELVVRETVAPVQRHRKKKE